MKRYRELRDDLITNNYDRNVDVDVDDELNEGGLRTLGGVVLLNKVRTISKQIQNIKVNSTDDFDKKLDKLFKKIDLLSKQNLVTSLSVVQLGIMKDKR